MPRVYVRGRWSGAPSRRVGRRRVARVRRGLLSMVNRGRIGPKQPVQYFKRTVYISGWNTAVATGDVYGALQFQLNYITNYTEFTALYDQYKITGVKVTLIPRGNSSDIGTGGTTGQSVGVFSVIDRDDATAPTALTELVQYQNMRMTRSTQQHKRFLRPSPVAPIYAPGGAYMVPKYNPWIDCSTGSSVPHYGIKYCLQQLPNGTQIYDAKFDYYLAFKNVR